MLYVQAMQLAVCNRWHCLPVNDQVLVATGYPVFVVTLRELGYQTIALDMGEFQKLDGGLSCLSLPF
jgi:dimethylargininase